MKKVLFITLLLFMGLQMGCDAPEPRRPINKKKQYFLSQSAQRNKSRMANEQALFQNIRNDEPQREYQNSSKGFWYAIIEGEAIQKPLPIKGQEVVMRYRIEDLSGNVLYDEEQLGEVRFLVDQEDYLPALREAAKVLREGQKGIFLFPSYLCFGYQGDFEKIGSNQPLRFVIKLVSLSKFNS